jgi:hypothetical protein
VPKPYDPKADGCPLFIGHPIRDIVYGIMVLVSFADGIGCYALFAIGTALLVHAGILPADVPATSACVYMGLAPALIPMAAIFLLGQRR